MPGGDRTGPRGQGPLTGRRAGYCSGYNTPGFTNPMHGSGMGYGGGYGGRFGGGFRGGYGGGGWGYGGRRGWRNRFYATGQPFWARGETPPPANPGPTSEADKAEE